MIVFYRLVYAVFFFFRINIDIMKTSIATDRPPIWAVAKIKIKRTVGGDCVIWFEVRGILAKRPTISALFWVRLEPVAVQYATITRTKIISRQTRTPQENKVVWCGSSTYAWQVGHQYPPSLVRYARACVFPSSVQSGHLIRSAVLIPSPPYGTRQGRYCRSIRSVHDCRPYTGTP